MFGALWNKIKEIIKKMLPKKSVENVLHVSPAISDRMADAIQLWSDMYEGASPWCREPSYDDPTRIVSIGLPALIASEKARMATLEMKTEISAPTQEVSAATNPVDSSMPQSTPDNDGGTGSVTAQSQPSLQSKKDNVVSGGAQSATTRQVSDESTERASFLNSQYKKLLRQLRRQIEYGIAKGGLVIKPYVVMYNTDRTVTQQNASETQNNASGETPRTSASNNSTQKSNAESNTSANSTRLSYNPALPKAEIEFDFIQADRFFPLSFDANGKVLEAVFIQTKLDKAKERVYIRLEYHKLDGRRVTVKNFAFESTDTSLANSSNVRSATNLGKQISLKEGNHSNDYRNGGQVCC